MIVMEFCPGGDLEKHLRKQGATITDYERIIYLVEVGIRVTSLDSKKTDRISNLQPRWESKLERLEKSDLLRFSHFFPKNRIYFVNLLKYELC